MEALHDARLQVNLKTVIGLTALSGSALDCRCTDGTIAYPAGCTVVLLDRDGCGQSHLVSASKKAITCLAFSPDGHYLATGECGHQPVVRVWDLSSEEAVLVAELRGHNFGLSCVLFSPQSKLLVSVGDQHDLMVNVWDWRSGLLVASSKVSSKVMAAAFCESGDYFVTVGVRHVKFWYVERAKASAKMEEGRLPLQGRSAILADQRNNVFRDVDCGRGDLSSNTYAVTQSGLLCQFSSRRQLEKWVELKTQAASSICVSDELVFVGCADGLLRVFNARSLSYMCTLPRPHYLGVDVAADLATEAPSVASYPDVVAVIYEPAASRLACIYDDHSLYIWDVSDCKRACKVASLMAHSGSVWALDVCPPVTGKDGPVPAGTFVTCSTDDTIRLWNLDLPADCQSPYGKELMKIIYCDPECVCLRDPEMGGDTMKERNGYQLDGRSGVRTISVSPDCRHLASGDRNGNIRVYAMDTLDLVQDLQAHDGDVLCLEYCRSGDSLLACGSRDRLLHLLDVDRDYEPLCTLDEHSGSITAVRFARLAGELLLLSCGADKCVLYRRVDWDRQVQLIRSVQTHTTIYDMVVHEPTDSVYTACQDRQVRAYALSDGRPLGAVKGSLSDEGTVIKVELDPSGTFMATCSNDKNVYLFDLASSGKCVAVLGGHSELVTGVKFTDDCGHLITVSGDGCIFVWKLDDGLVDQIALRCRQADGRPVLLSQYDSDQSNQLSPFSPLNEQSSNEHQSVNTSGASDVPEMSAKWAHLGEHFDDSGGHLKLDAKVRRHDMQSQTFEDDHDADEFKVNARSDMLKRQIQCVHYDRDGDAEERNSPGMVMDDRSAAAGGQVVISPPPERYPYGPMDSLFRRRQMAVLGEQQSAESAAGAEELGDGGAFRRGAPNRQSLTTRFLHRSAVERKANRASGTAGDSLSRLSTSPSLASSLSGLSSVERPESDRIMGPKGSMAPGKKADVSSDFGLPNHASSPVSPSALSSSLSYQRLERLRRPLKLPLRNGSPVQPAMKGADVGPTKQSYGNRRHVTLPTYLSPLKTTVENYEQSELHARSQSPVVNRDTTIQELCKALLLQEVLSPNRRRYGRLGLTSLDVVPQDTLRNSYSMTSLAPLPPDRRQTAAMRRLSDIRQKLRKSHENLWENGGGGGGYPYESSFLLNKSRSTTSLAYNMQRGVSMASLDVAAGGQQEPQPRFWARRDMTRSMGYLPSAEEESWMPTKLSSAVRDFERLSRSDLSSGYGGGGGGGKGEGDGLQLYSRSTTLPRFYRVNGPVQRKANQMRTGRAPGDSEDSSDTPTQGSVHRYASPRRRHGSNVSAVDRYYETAASGGGGGGQSAFPVRDRRRLTNVVSSQRLLEALPNKRATSYLNKLLDSPPARYGGYEEHPRPYGTGAALERSRQEAEFQGLHFARMDDHCRETADSFMTALDKMLHAFHMIVDDVDLADEQKQRLVALLMPKLQSAQKRLNMALHGSSNAAASDMVSKPTGEDSTEDGYADVKRF